MIRADDLNMQPVHDPVSSVVLQASLANIDSVMVAGRWKKRAGRLLGVDLGAASWRAAARRAARSPPRSACSRGGGWRMESRAATMSESR